MVAEHRKDNKKIRVDIIHTLRQICPHSQNDKIRIELESILIDKSISKETIEAVSDALSVIGDTNTINILLKKISKMDFTTSAAPYLNSLKFLFSKLLDSESAGETQNLSKKAIRIALDRCKNTSNQEEILRSAQLLNVICNYN